MEKLGFYGATLIGIGAIVGGGIFVLGGVAISTAGPAAMIAFLLNGLLALLTARSYAFISDIFPESGGTYLYTKRILSVRAAFVIGWMLWLAHIVASLLYALGFSAYFLSMLGQVVPNLEQFAPMRVLTILFSALACAFYTYLASRKLQSGGKISNISKLILFFGLIGVGFVLILSGNVEEPTSHLAPFFEGGFSGLIAAMGYTFIALQGFELIASSAGEIDSPRKIVPRAMYTSLGMALIIYIPILLITVMGGIPTGASPAEWCSSRADTCIADAFKHFLGTTGYWVIALSAVAATLSALQANLIASAKMAKVMADDRTLPAILSSLHEKFSTPDTALIVNFVIVLILLLALPDATAAGSAASLTFLICFSFTHILASIIARRQEGSPARWVVPIIGAVLCLSLAAFQLSVEQSGAVLLTGWVLVGALFYYIFLSKRAETLDAFVAAHSPTLFSYRGNYQTVLVPMKNPEHVNALLQTALTIGPESYSKIILLSIAERSEERSVLNENIKQASDVISNALTLSSLQEKRKLQGIVSIHESVSGGITEVAKTHGCETLLIGLQGEKTRLALEGYHTLFKSLSKTNIVLLKTPQGWEPDSVAKVLVPIGGKGEHDKLRARVLGRLISFGIKNITFLRIIPESATESSLARIGRGLSQRVADETKGYGTSLILQSRNIEETILENAGPDTLMILGIETENTEPQQNEESFATRLARKHTGASLLLRNKT